MVNKIWLSPEGYHEEELRALVGALQADGHGIFSFALHSPSLEAGHTPYVTCQRELDDFLGRCRQFFEFFIGAIGGIPSTPIEIKGLLTSSQMLVQDKEPTTKPSCASSSLLKMRMGLER
jgi:hypothetical protein